jgi:hypothetical protein
VKLALLGTGLQRAACRCGLEREGLRTIATSSVRRRRALHARDLHPRSS